MLNSDVSSPGRGNHQVSGAGKRMKRRRRGANPGAPSFRSPLTALVVAFSLIIQLVAAPYHQALAGPGFAGSETARIAAEFKATFGDAAALCVETDSKGAPPSPVGHCDDQCPLCRFGVQAAALVASELPALPARLDAVCLSLGTTPERDAVPACPAQQNRARAPPFAV
jgi:hypothetical protein